MLVKCRTILTELPGMVTHKHKCDECGFVWRHSDSCAGDLHAHLCPVCGVKQYFRYEGLDEPIVHPDDQEGILKLRVEAYK